MFFIGWVLMALFVLGCYQVIRIINWIVKKATNRPD